MSGSLEAILLLFGISSILATGIFLITKIHFHKWIRDDDVVLETQTWDELAPVAFGGHKIGEFKRNIMVVVEKCSKCGKERAWRGYSNESPGWGATELSVDYARRIIETKLKHPAGKV